jgi:hypothetical protein
MVFRTVEARKLETISATMVVDRMSLATALLSPLPVIARASRIETPGGSMRPPPQALQH